MLAVVVDFNSTPDLDDLLSAMMEGVALGSVFGLAWRGPEKVISQADPNEHHPDNVRVCV